ncbi:hypothetical protein GRX03_06875 [Halovenus sp. WSH3]|uniref:Uncharacterized protein n=1 Tax=Halovenus carboxidivorans TaxID=2692199 RepID=A0A6B0SZN9_9EURY|nr:DUF5810 domain-containing protein [Halovenus carboxidivorans]MXR51328.1 hypothetical protein [Halovenus carboxidivorans]
MGYSCPICGDPQADGVHLANHLAITAMARGGEHEEFLDETVPGWQELGEEELAAELTDAAEETEYPQVFEDTTGPDHEHDHDHGTDPAHVGGTDPAGSIPFETDMPDDPADGETEDIVEEAMEMTRKRRANAAEPDDSDEEPETE